MEDFSTALSKALNVLLPKNFPYIQRVNNVVAQKIGWNQNIKFQIIVNPKWFFQILSKKKLDYYFDEYKKYGSISLSPYSVELDLAEEFKFSELDTYIDSILSALGFGDLVTRKYDVEFLILD